MESATDFEKAFFIVHCRILSCTQKFSFEIFKTKKNLFPIDCTQMFPNDCLQMLAKRIYISEGGRSLNIKIFYSQKRPADFFATGATKTCHIIFLIFNQNTQKCDVIDKWGGKTVIF